MPLSSSDDTQVVAQVGVGKLVRCRAKVNVRPYLCLVFQQVCYGQVVFFNRSCGCQSLSLMMCSRLAQVVSAKDTQSSAPSYFPHMVAEL